MALLSHSDRRGVGAVRVKQRVRQCGRQAYPCAQGLLRFPGR
jgi:hypothetical protein